MNRIRVSVVTPSYNQGQFIEETILSVLNQSYQNIQYILIDGGSTDNTMEIVEKYRSRIDIVVHERDKGQSDAINKGFKMADGELVGWINSDDVLYPDCVETMVQMYEKHANGSIFHGSIIDITDGDSNIKGKKKYYIPSSDHLLNQDFDVIQPGSFYSRANLIKVNYLDESIHYCMDLDLWLRLLKYGSIHSFDEYPLATIRKWEGTKTSTGMNKFLSEIKKCILKHGGRRTSRNMLRINIEMLKNTIRPLLNK